MSGKVSLCKQNSAGKKGDHRKAVTCTKSCDFGVLRYAKHVCRKVAAVAVRVTSRSGPAPKLPRHNNHPNCKEIRAKTSVAPVDSQRAEAIHDCIDFINSSSSLPRSNSVAR